MNIRRGIATASAALLLSPLAVSITATTATAFGGNCSAVKQTQAVRWGLDNHRARAICSSIQGDTKARATLVRNGGPDYHSVWFTTTNRYYYTGWYTCYAGCSARVSLERV